jgi:signal transduction histidine kinase
MIGIALILFGALGVVEAGRLVRDAARARRLNRAMHELRRPLQAIALSLEARSPDLVGAEACLEQARRALRELDATVNGRRPGTIVRRARITEVMEALDRRWRFADVEVEGPARDGDIEADVDRLGAALDNLVANALRHGSGVVRVRACTDRAKARFEVRDEGSGPSATGEAMQPRDPRRGHGLHVVAGVAATHGGSVTPARRTQGGGTLAAISLPVAGPDSPGRG